jgi:hypothetical protein
MITNFCNFCQFFGEKFGVFVKNQCYDQNFAKTSSKLRKNANFFGENIFKIITSVPGVDLKLQIDGFLYICLLLYRQFPSLFLLKVKLYMEYRSVERQRVLYVVYCHFNAISNDKLLTSQIFDLLNWCHGISWNDSSWNDISWNDTSWNLKN